MRAAIAIDDWKLPIFERALSNAGYTYEQRKGFTAETVHLYIDTEDLNRLASIVKRAEFESQTRQWTMTDAHACPGYTCERPECVRRQRDELRERCEKLSAWLNDNTTFYDVASGEMRVPVLASVAKRVWYHATDDLVSWPFTAVVEWAMRCEAPKDASPHD